MKKVFFCFITFILITGLLGACATDRTDDAAINKQPQHADNEQLNGQSDEAETVNITLSKDKGKTTISKKKIHVKKGDLLMDVLKQNFKIEEDGGFINSIDGIAPKKDEKKAWLYSVNGKMANVGAKDYKLEPGDEVVFDLQSWE